jgi:hypothetical protein
VSWGLLMTEDGRLKMERKVLSGDGALFIRNMFLLSAAFERVNVPVIFVTDVDRCPCECLDPSFSTSLRISATQTFEFPQKVAKTRQERFVM